MSHGVPHLRPQRGHAARVWIYRALRGTPLGDRSRRQVFRHAKRLFPHRVSRPRRGDRGLYDDRRARRQPGVQDQGERGAFGRELSPSLRGEIRRDALRPVARPAAFRGGPCSRIRGRQAFGEARGSQGPLRHHPERRHPHEPQRQRRHEL